jgi:hypothetical protein
MLVKNTLSRSIVAFCACKITELSFSAWLKLRKKLTLRFYKEDSEQIATIGKKVMQ